MKVHLELLYHYRCDECQRWWSVADIQPTVNQLVCCPHCSHPNKIEGVERSSSEEWKESLSDAIAMLKIGQIYKAQEDTKTVKVREGAKILSISYSSPSQVGYIVILLDRKLVGHAAPCVLPIKEFKQKHPVLHQPSEEPPAT